MKNKVLECIIRLVKWWIMRKLIILRGAMGCGKSTFIKEHNLEKFTLSSDQIRLMFNAPQMNLKYYEEIPQFNNKKVWELLYSLLLP